MEIHVPAVMLVVLLGGIRRTLLVVLALCDDLCHWYWDAVDMIVLPLLSFLLPLLSDSPSLAPCEITRIQYRVSASQWLTRFDAIDGSHAVQPCNIVSHARHVEKEEPDVELQLTLEES